MKNNAVSIKNLTKEIKNTKILSDINMSVKIGDICGIIGRNASGKSMLFKCIANLVTINSGEIYIFGDKATKNQSYSNKMGFLIEHPAFLPNFSGLDNLKILSELNHLSDIDYIRQLMEELGLNPCDKKSYRKYSLGMRQKLGIVSALMDKHPIIILDEPTNNIDEESVTLVRNIITRYNKEYATTFLLTSHNPMDIEILCTQVYEIKNGKLSK